MVAGEDGQRFRQVRTHGADEEADAVGVAEGFAEVGAAEVGAVLDFVALGVADVGVPLGFGDGVVLETGALGLIEADTLTEALALPVGVIVIVGLALADGDHDGVPELLPDGEPDTVGDPESVGVCVGRPVGVSDADGVPVGRPVGVGVPDGRTEVTVSVGTGIVGPPLLSAGFGASVVGDSDGVGVVVGGADVGFCVGVAVGRGCVVVGDVLGFAEVMGWAGAVVVGAMLGVEAALVGLWDVGWPYVTVTVTPISGPVLVIGTTARGGATTTPATTQAAAANQALAARAIVPPDCTVTCVQPVRPGSNPSKPTRSPGSPVPCQAIGARPDRI